MIRALLALAGRVQRVPLAAYTRDADARRRLAMLDQRAEMLAEARRLFNVAGATEGFAARSRIYAQAMAMEARSEALLWRAGGEEGEAAALERQAEEYDRLAGMPRPVPSEPVEASHA
jgi:hypothetical protein